MKLEPGIDKNFGIQYIHRLKIKEFEFFFGEYFIFIKVGKDYDLFQLVAFLNFFFKKRKEAGGLVLFVIKENERFQIEKRRVKIKEYWNVINKIQTEDVFFIINRPEFGSFYKSGENFSGEFKGFEFRFKYALKN